jgi:hypothetical protein
MNKPLQDQDMQLYTGRQQLLTAAAGADLGITLKEM